jgi:hypothetical protein
MAGRVEWEDLSDGQRRGLTVGIVVQLALAVTAWRDLARRPAEQVRGPKALWAALIAVNGVGPVSYALVGVRR